VTAAVVAVPLGSCAVGPHYVAPTPPADGVSGFVSSQAAIASSVEPPADWWRLYATPAIDQLVQEALTHNRNLLVAAANLAEARAALALARAGRFPATTLSAGAQYGVTSDTAFADTLLDRPASNPSPFYSVGLDASYEVDLFGRVRRTIQAAAADYGAQRAAEDAIRISVAGETTRAYVNACAYARELEVARQSLAVVTQTEEVTEKEAAAGSASDFDVARARELVAQTRASLPVYEDERQTALFELAVLTGRPPEEISAAARDCRTPPKLATVLPVGEVGGLFRRRPDVRQAERQLAANVARIGVATANLYPTITIGLSADSAASSVRGLGSRRNLSYGVGPLLSWSFPNILVAKAEIREARAAASASYASFEGAVLQALQDVEEALTAYGSELDRNAALAMARDQSQKAFDLAQTRYRLGRVSYLDLLTAETDLVNVNASLAASDQALASDQVTVFKTLGGGWEQAPEAEPLAVVDGRTGAASPIR
jgi:NodT family efflux transporter outer membrane factor (OMF) lipoprotein